jgi:hypothetical protein
MSSYLKEEDYTDYFEMTEDVLDELMDELKELMNNMSSFSVDEEDIEEIEIESFFFKSNEYEIQQIESCLQLMHDYILTNPTVISEPDFEETMIDDVKELIKLNYDSFFWTGELKEIFDEELAEIIESALKLLYIHFIPCREGGQNQEQEGQLTLIYTPLLAALKAQPQPAQRTPEWYAFRYNLITASNAYKAFEQSQSIQNALIYEKCSAEKPQEPNENVAEKDSKIITGVFSDKKGKNGPTTSGIVVNIHSPMHWGQKYEPVSVMLYEHNYDTKVGDYGCIQHPKYSFLGASPDGINDEILDNGLFGRMLEIKNIVNREIDGIPKKEYWIQMQLQMETCNLWECDFLETRFIEIDEERYLEESLENPLIKDKGIIMYFAKSDGNPFYVYKPLCQTYEYFNEVWQDEQIEEQQKLGRCWIQNIFWKLEEYSCVLVLRNKLWFELNIDALEKLWLIVLKERENGQWTSRCPQKREKKEVVKSNDNCGVKFCKETGKFIST